MKIQREELHRRVKELAEVAEDRGKDWQQEAANLPDDDVIARIGLLASILDIDIGLALDTGISVNDTMNSEE